MALYPRLLLLYMCGAAALRGDYSDVDKFWPTTLAAFVVVTWRIDLWCVCVRKRGPRTHIRVYREHQRERGSVCAPQDIKTAGALLLAWLVVDNSPDAVCGDRKQTYSNYFRSFGIIPLMSCVHLRRSQPPHTHRQLFARPAAAKARAPNKSLCALLPVRLLFSRLAPKLGRPKIKCTHFCPLGMRTTSQRLFRQRMRSILQHFFVKWYWF
jgi:hypothetical protein